MDISGKGVISKSEIALNRHRIQKPRILLTLGDPAGIGPEIFLKALQKPSLRKRAHFLILGHTPTLDATARTLGLSPCWTPTDSLRFDEEPLLWDSFSHPTPIPPGRWSLTSGRMSLQWVEQAISILQEGGADALVTGPISKAAWEKAGCPYPGHTELLANRLGEKKPVMMLATQRLRVALATIHIPLAAVPSRLSTASLIEMATILHEELRCYFGIEKPRIAVLGLNPHAGEEGVLGSEEKEIIAPAIRTLRRRGIDAQGPLPADTAFYYAKEGAYDVVFAMYHDQGLGPFKTVAFDTGVNVTLGLSIIRTSVDHGTAFDIAGKGIARSRSCEAAIELAITMVKAKQRLCPSNSKS